MAAKTKVARLESEIEKCRSEANWAKALDLARQISNKSPALEALSILCSGESRLERYLLENPPNDSNIIRARSELREAHQQLSDALKADPKPGLRQEIMLLLGKLHYAQGDYQRALVVYDEINLDAITVQSVSNRKLKIIGEAYAIKGLCLDKQPLGSTSKFKQAEREESVIQCFEKSGDISLLQLQELHDRGKGTPTTMSLQAAGIWTLNDTDSSTLGPMVETAIQRTPILYIRNGKLSEGIGRFREMMRAVETRAVQGLRQVLARQLAEVLLRGVCESTYKPITEDSNAQCDSNKPRKYSGDNLFYPTNVNEETLLLLLISESMATLDAVLDRSPEHAEARKHTFHNTTAVYDLLTIALVRRAQFHMLTETFERAMKFSFDEFHIWYQFALSLISAEKYNRALLVLKECMRLEPKNVVVFLQSAKICYENVHNYDQGIENSEAMVELGDANPMLAKSYLSLGIGYSLKADEAKLQVTRQEYQRKALNVFLRAQTLDNNEHLAEFHVAMQLAILRQIPEALKHVRRALQLRSDHVHSLHLLALLLSSQKQYEEALQLVEAAVTEYPKNFNLLVTKSRLEEVVYGVEEALHTCKYMLQLWKDVYEAALEKEDDPKAENSREQRGTGLIDRVTADTRSLVALHLSELSDRDSGSIRAESIAASRVEQALSEVVSSMNSNYTPKQGPNSTWTLQAQIWLHLGEIYLSLERQEEAQACVHEAGAIFPVSHMVSYMKGRLHEHRGELYESKQCYENAISINPSHVKSLQQLGMILHQLGNDHLAEKVLRDAVNSDPTAAKSWHNLGVVLQVLNEFDAAAECLVTAVDLETTSPISPFTIIPRTIQ